MLRSVLLLFLVYIFLSLPACGDSNDGDDGDNSAADGDLDVDTDYSLETDVEEQSAENVSESEVEEESLSEYESEKQTEDSEDILPFHIEREPEGEALSEAEISDTTEAVLAMWRETRYFQWLLDTGHGMAEDNEWGYPAYKLWWQDTLAVKEGDTVTFRHVEGGGDNILLRTARVLIYALSGHMKTGDERLREISVQFMRGIQALYTSMVWENENPPIDTIMARAVFTHNHSYLASGGRRASVDYEPAKKEDIDRRHDVLHNPGNPTFGDIWVRSKRSKDDLPFLYRLVPVLMRAEEKEKETDTELAGEATKTLAYIRGFCRDIVDHEYRIRTKDPDGIPYEIFYDGGPDEFACYTAYDWLDANAECNAKLATALIGYQEPLGNNCLDGSGGSYETMAIWTHYWETPIIYYFHIAALAEALAEGQNDAAFNLAAGLERRTDEYMNDQEFRLTVGTWDGDAATFFITAASYGFPLTAREARLVSHELQRASVHYRASPLWDLWSESLADGEYDFIPGDGVSGDVVDGQTSVFQPAEISALLEYCGSPFKDSSSSPFVDCDRLFDTTQW